MEYVRYAIRKQWSTREFRCILDCRAISTRARTPNVLEPFSTCSRAPVEEPYGCTTCSCNCSDGFQAIPEVKRRRAARSVRSGARSLISLPSRLFSRPREPFFRATSRKPTLHCSLESSRRASDARDTESLDRANENVDERFRCVDRCLLDHFCLRVTLGDDTVLGDSVRECLSNEVF